MDHVKSRLRHLSHGEDQIGVHLSSHPLPRHAAWSEISVKPEKIVYKMLKIQPAAIHAVKRLAI